MLVNLLVKNYAIIRESSIHFDDKLNIITGETGAGKSILMGALGLILGERADTKVLHHADEKCVVEGIFQIQSYRLEKYFEREVLDYDNTCILRREISGNGKSRAFINDTPVTLNQLKELGSQLVDIVSQNQTMELNNHSFQLAVLDAYAQTDNELNAYQSIFAKWQHCKQQLDELIVRETQARKDEDYLKFILNEITEANVQPNELHELEQQLDVLSNADQIQKAAAQGYLALNANENSVVDALNAIRQALSPVAKHHSGIHALADRLQSSIIELKDIAAELETIAEQTESNQEKLAYTESRLQLLFNLLKKHHLQNTEELIALRTQLTSDVNAIGSLQEEIIRLEQQKAILENQLNDAATRLTAKRNQAIPKIEKAMKELLKQVQLPEATLNVNLTANTAFGVDGCDHIQFMFTANKGSALQPMNKVASGGEMSRVMLCLKSLINDKVALPTVVFDEIDTGISGEAALKVAQVMKKHAATHQVIAITHLPQIAGKADAHFYVYKTTDATTTHTYIKKLNTTERVEEIARMLHGENPSDKVIEAAKELMNLKK